MRGLSLRARLSLAFALLALVPVAAVVPAALRNLRRTLTEELEARADGTVLSARAELEQRCADHRRAVRDLLDSPVLEDVARRSRPGASPGPLLSDSARRAMEARGLSVLTFLSDDGRTLSSGHLPARFLDPAPAERALAERLQKGCDVADVMVPQEDGLLSVPALVTGGALEYGSVRIWVLAGSRLDRGVAQQLAALTGAHVTLTEDGREVATSGPAVETAFSRTLPVGAPGQKVLVTLSLPANAVTQAEHGLTRAFLVLASVGLLLAGVLGLVVARRVSLPLEALTVGARSVTLGALDTHITVKATGEVETLRLAFNQMLDQLRRATDQRLAAERVAAWQEIARSLAHELKNPLTPIQMSLETLMAAANKGELPRFREMFQESAGGMLEEVQRLRRTVDAFSRFARLPKPQLETLDLSELTRHLLAVHGAMPPHIQLTATLEPGLTIRGDRDQLTQVLVNLVGNAREALAERGGRVEVVARREGRDAWVEVADTGPGVPLEQRPRLFEPYFTTKTQGTGLGLAISARIAQEHEGTLSLDPAPPRPVPGSG